MSLAKSIVFFALVAFVAGAVKIKPLKQAKPAISEGISSRAVCGDEYITGTGGVIQSPNYPNGYGPSESCGWFLTAENGGRIAFAVVDLDTEEGFDTLIVRDGVTGQSPILIELSGQASNFAVLSTQSSIFVGFFSDSSVQGVGFNATWRQVNSTNTFEVLNLLN